MLLARDCSRPKKVGRYREKKATLQGDILFFIGCTTLSLLVLLRKELLYYPIVWVHAKEMLPDIFDNNLSANSYSSNVGFSRTSARSFAKATLSQRYIHTRPYDSRPESLRCEARNLYIHARITRGSWQRPFLRVTGGKKKKKIFAV